MWALAQPLHPAIPIGGLEVEAFPVQTRRSNGCEAGRKGRNPE